MHGIYEASLALRRELGDEAELASALYDLGHAISCVAAVKNTDRGRTLLVESLEHYRSLGSPMGEAWLVWALGCNRHFAGDNRAAVNELGEALELFRELDDPFGLAWALTMRGAAAQLTGQGASWRPSTSARRCRSSRRSTTCPVSTP